MKLKLLLLSFFSVASLAQEEVVEVGKHANVNLDSVTMIMSLVMVLALIIVSAWILRNFNVVNKSVAGMKVITSLPLGHKEKLVVVQVGDEQLLLSVSGQQISLLKTLDKPLEIGEAVPIELNQTFSRFFNKPNN